MLCWITLQVFKKVSVAINRASTEFRTFLNEERRSAPLQRLTKLKKKKGRSNKRKEEEEGKKKKEKKREKRKKAEISDQRCIALFEQ